MSLLWDADTDYISHGNASELDMTVGTWIVWVRRNSTGNRRIITKSAFEDGHRWFAFGYDAGGDILFFALDNGTSNLAATALETSFTPSLATTGKWLCVAASFDCYGGNDQKIYGGDADNPLSEPSAYTEQYVGSGTPVSGSADPLYVGVREDGVQNIDGEIAWIGIWNRRLTLAEMIDQQYRPHPTEGCILFSHYGWNGTTSVPDLSGRGHHGTGSGCDIGTSHAPYNPGWWRSFRSFVSAAVAPTRFYFPSTGTADPTPAYDGAWDITTGAARLPLVATDPSLTSFYTKAYFDTDNADTDHLIYQFVSEAIAAQVIPAQTVKFQMRGLEGAGQDNMVFSLVIKVWDALGTTLRGTILSLTRDDTEADDTTLTNRSFSATTTEVEATASTDVLVVEIGCGGNPSGGADHDLSIRIGDPSGTDLPEDDTDTTDKLPWIEFPNLSLITGTTDYQSLVAVAVCSAVLATTSTRFLTIAATALGVVVMSRFIEAYRTLAATVVADPVIVAVGTWYQTLAATALGVAALTASKFAEVTLAATAVCVAGMATVATWYRTLAVTVVASAAIAPVATHYLTIAATSICLAAITSVTTWYRTLAATAVGVAALTKKMFVDIAATAIGVAAIVALKVYGRTLAATAVGVATLSTTATWFLDLDATAIGTAVISTVSTRFRALAATAVGVAIISTVTTWYRTLAVFTIGVASLVAGKVAEQALNATALGVAGLSTIKVSAQTLAATALGVATLATVTTWQRTLAATAEGVAAMSRFIEATRTLAATAVGVAGMSRLKTFYRDLDATVIGIAGLIPAAKGGPKIAGYTNWNEPANTQLPTLTYPADIAAGETLVSFMVTDGDNISSGWPTGWEELGAADQSSAAHHAVHIKKAVGTETGSFTIDLASNEQCCGVIIRITGASATWPDEKPAISASTTGTDVSIEIANCAPGAGVKEFLWLASCGQDDDDVCTAIGDSFTDLLITDSGSSNNSCCGAWARKSTDNIASYDHPDGFTQPTAENWISFMTAIFPLVTGETFYETLDAVALAVAGLTELPTHVQTLAATDLGLATLATVATFYRNLSATSVGVAELTKKMYVTLSATAIGVATLLGVVVSLVSMSATAVGVALMTAVPTFAQTVAATAVGQAVITTLVTWYRTLAATAIGQAVLSTKATYYRTLSATAIGVAGIATAITRFKTLAATAIGVAVIATVTTWGRMLSAIQVGVAAIGTLFIPGEEPPPSARPERRESRRWLRTFGRWRKGHRK